MRIWIVSFYVLALAANLAMAADQPSIDRGKELFNSTSLGTNGNSCAGCHAEGAGLKAINAYSDAKLEGIINKCISKALDGTPLPSGSRDLASMVAYLKSIIMVAAP